LTKTIYKKPTVNIILNGEKLKSFLTMIRYKIRMSFSPLLCNVILKVLANLTRQDKIIKVYTLERKK